MCVHVCVLVRVRFCEGAKQKDRGGVCIER